MSEIPTDVANVTVCVLEFLYNNGKDEWEWQAHEYAYPVDSVSEVTRADGLFTLHFEEGSALEYPIQLIQWVTWDAVK